jgi:FixJ family two-component response regulator
MGMTVFDQPLERFSGLDPADLVFPFPTKKTGEAMAEGVVVAVVDDDESVRKAIKRLINASGLPVEDFASSEDFLRSDAYRDAACLILDVRLPGMGGLELQSKLAASNRNVPIIFISAHGDDQTRSRALEAGAIDFLQKPFGEADLLNAVDRCLSSGSNQSVSGEEQKHQ